MPTTHPACDLGYDLCPLCRSVEEADAAHGHGPDIEACPECGGRGDLNGEPCELCDGTGVNPASTEEADAKNVEADLEWLAGRPVVVGAGIDWGDVPY